MKKKIWLGVLALIVIAISFGLYRLGSPSKPVNQDMASNAMEFDVTREDLSKTIDVKGKSSYLNETFVYAPFDAEILKWHVKDGAQLQKGALLFSLDRMKMSNEIAQLEANLKKTDLETRLGNLESNSSDPSVSLSLSEYDAKKGFVEREKNKIMSELNQVNGKINRSELDSKRKKLQQADFKAPENGIFLFEDSSKIPQVVHQNDRLGKIVDLDKLQLVSYVGEQDVFQIKPGMPVKVKINALKGTILDGKVERVSKFAKTGTDQNSSQAAQFQVNISLQKNENLIAGLTLTGSIETANKPGVVVVPTIAVQREKDQYYVMIKSGGSFTKKYIKIGLETPDKTEVIEGLKEGDKVVLQ